jgi:DNA invertase Pin-like site-specific DNA recombinase
MTPSASSKVTTAHLQRNAYLYVRQSTLRQVFENTESTKRQYALRERAIALGWPTEQVITIDSDQGHSGASAADREGFQTLVAEVGLGHAGIVLGLEVSRLARSSTDWHRLLEICALTDTLILDEDGIYDPSHFNDRLLLGLKGTMSEAELHVLKARLRGGILSKARRGELESPLPVGLVYASDGRVVLDPDRQVQDTVRLFFETFRRTGSAWATVRYFRQRQLLFPQRLRTGPRKGELIFAPLLHSRARQMLQNPRYAGAFAFGRTRTRKRGDGRNHVERLPRDEWHTFLPDHHEGYISWADYEDHVRILRENAQAYGSERRRSPPREGPALLQGLVLCGACGERMTVRYHTRRAQIVPDYICQRGLVQKGEPICQRIPGAGLDAAIGRLLIESMTPLALEVCLAVQEEIRSRAEELERVRRSEIERARYEAELAERRYRRVDPDHRLVADALEADWNNKLRTLSEVEEAYQRSREGDALVLDETRRAEIFSLASDFPRLWNAPETAQREKKRITRLLIEDVTLLKREDGLTAHVRFRGGATRTLDLPRALSAWESRQTPSAVVREIDDLLDEHTDGEIAHILNERGRTSGEGLPFHPLLVAGIRRRYGLKSRYARLRQRGYLDLHEMAAALAVDPATVKIWRRAGLLIGYAYSDKNECLYPPPGPDRPQKHRWKGLSSHRRSGNSPQSCQGGAV